MPFVWGIGLGGAAICAFLMKGLPGVTWIRFVVWLVLGLIVYLLYGVRHSVMRRRARGENVPEIGAAY